MTRDNVTYRELITNLDKTRNEVLNKIDDLADTIDNKFATKEELYSEIGKIDGKYNTTKDIVYGAAKIILTAVVGGILAVVIFKVKLPDLFG